MVGLRARLRHPQLNATGYCRYKHDSLAVGRMSSADLRIDLGREVRGRELGARRAEWTHNTTEGQQPED